MDTIFITGLRVEAMIGAHNWEQRVMRTLVLDLELACDARLAAAHDRLADAIDYKTVSDRVTELCRQSRYRLLETLAETIAETLMQEFGITWLRLAVHKPGAVPGADTVGVRIERGSTEGA
jgi:dihydroneopterin aldolase